MPEGRLIHFGFAQPFMGMLAVTAATVIFVRPLWLAIICLAVFVAIMELCNRWVLRRVDRCIAEWGESHGFHQVERQPRGGFVSWGWSLLCWAEMYHYHAIDKDGSERRITASYQCDLFGLRLRTLAEADDATGGPAAV